MIVIVGGGQAAAQLVFSLRQGGGQERILLLSEETHLPYQHPPLSKAYLSGAVDRQRLWIRSADFYRDRDIDLRPGQRVVNVDRAALEVHTAAGECFAYDRLALTCGARVRRLAVPGDTLQGVHYLRTLDDADALVHALQDAVNVVVVGGGFLGLEFAAMGTFLGKSVVLLETAAQLIPRVGAACIREFYRARHEQHGVRVHTGVQVAEFAGADGRVREVRCGDGAVHPADVVLVSVGVIPNTELAEAAGLETCNGVLVDAQARSSDPAVVCAGDLAACVQTWAHDTTAAIRLESVQNATDQARTAAATLLGEAPREGTPVPWFWSDQYKLKLQMAGLSGGHDTQVVRGQPDTAAFAVCYFREAQFIAMDSIARPADHAAARKLLARGVALTPEQAADENFALKSLL